MRILHVFCGEAAALAWEGRFKSRSAQPYNEPSQTFGADLNSQNNQAATHLEPSSA